MPGGAVGVSVFYVLSGYLICSMLLKDGMLSTPNILKFIVRRLGRIYPMYVIHIAALALLFAITSPEKLAGLQNWSFNLLTFSGPVMDWMGYGVGVLWTLYVEFWFYVTFPFVLLAVILFPSKLSPDTKLLAGFAIVGAACFGISSYRFVGLVLAYYDHFLIGAAAAVIARRQRQGAVFSKPGAMIFGVLAILVAFAIQYPGNRGIEWHAQSLLGAIGAFTFILAVNSNPPLYNLRPVAFIGRISFSMYLVHAFLLDVMAIYVRQSDVGFALYLVAVVAVASATYRWVEKPTIAFVHRHLRFSNVQPILAA